MFVTVASIADGMELQERLEEAATPDNNTVSWPQMRVYLRAMARVIALWHEHSESQEAMITQINGHALECWRS